MKRNRNSFGAAATLRVKEKTFRFFRLGALAEHGIHLERLPFCIQILLENLLRREDGTNVTVDDIRFLSSWAPESEASREISFMPARVLMQDFTGIPAVVDLASMRDAMLTLGGDPQKINPLQPAEVIIDHSVQVDAFGTKGAIDFNTKLDFVRNRERFSFLKWAQSSLNNFSVVPSGMGICHQVNLESLASVVFLAPQRANGPNVVYPDTVIGTDSHTTMINGLGVLGWGAGGIEAEAAMLGQPVSMLVPQVVGFRLSGKLKEGANATDLVLTITETLRKHGVVGKFVEFYGPSIAELPVADRATIANMAPEYGATCGIFPVDEETLRYLRATGRDEDQIELVETYYREQGLFHTAETPEADYSAILRLDLSTVEASVAGPKRPQDRVSLSKVASSFQRQLAGMIGNERIFPGERETVTWEGGRAYAELRAIRNADRSSKTATNLMSVQERFGIDPDPFLDHGAVVIAAITSCTSTSNPYLMMAAGILAKKAVNKGLKTAPWVKTSLAPGSRVVTEYYAKSGLMKYLEALRFNVVGYGCTACIGNVGTLAPDVSRAIEQRRLVAVSVLSGNRNFEGRISPETKANYLMSPALVIAYALTGSISHDFERDPMGYDKAGRPVFLRDIWPSQLEVVEAIEHSINPAMFQKQYESISEGDKNWQQLDFPDGLAYQWNKNSSYIQRAPYFDGMGLAPQPVQDIDGARILVGLGDSITTDHISPAGSIKMNSPAGKYLSGLGVKPTEFNTYGSRRGNHEVMVRGTFANVRLQNKLTPQHEGGVTRVLPDGRMASIYDASLEYAQRGTMLGILAGKEYGSGSSRDWAAKGPKLLGVRFVLAESFERIHRSNLVGMGILPLQFLRGQSAESLGLTGEEVYKVGLRAGQLREMVENEFSDGKDITVHARSAAGKLTMFGVTIRIDTPKEITYYRHGGILPYVLRHLARTSS